MGKEFYERLAKPFRKNPCLATFLRLINRVCTIFVYALYIISLVILAVKFEWVKLVVIVAVPAIGFVVVTLLRRWLAMPRRFEIWDDSPLLGEHRPGLSFPSRHVYSAAVIALALGRLWWPVGVAVGIITLLLAVVRVIGGVHFIRDVVAGAAIGLLFGGIGFWVIPWLCQ